MISRLFSALTRARCNLSRRPCLRRTHEGLPLTDTQRGTYLLRAFLFTFLYNMRSLASPIAARAGDVRVALPGAFAPTKLTAGLRVEEQIQQLAPLRVGGRLLVVAAVVELHEAVADGRRERMLRSCASYRWCARK